MLADRIQQALEILNGEHVKGTLRDQATTFIGEDVDDRALEYLSATAGVSYQDTYRKAEKIGADPVDCQAVALTSVLVAGLAIGKRLGIEDGEKYAKDIAGGWD